MNTLPLTQECQLNALEIELANVQAQLTQAQQQINHLQHDLFTEQTTKKFPTTCSSTKRGVCLFFGNG